jgi:outer membrane immunogenic protein
MEGHMRHSLSVVALTTLFTTSALAADLPRKAPAYVPPAPIPFTWTGFYLGLHAGWGFGNSDATVVPPIGSDELFDPASIGNNANGFVGGLQVGYNWQFAPNWVIGIEGDVSGARIRDTSTAPVTLGGSPINTGIDHIFERDVRWLASIRGRLGYAADRWLLYVTGGGAWAGIDFTAGPAFPGATLAPITGNDTISGWTAGGGVEYAVTNNWTARIEYLFYDLDDLTIVNVSSFDPSVTATTMSKNQFHVVRLGVNYKF